MIGKIKKGKSFGGCIRYVMGKDNAEIIGSDGVLLGNNREIADSFNCQCLLNPKIKQPVGPHRVKLQTGRQAGIEQ